MDAQLSDINSEIEAKKAAIRELKALRAEEKELIGTSSEPQERIPAEETMPGAMKAEEILAKLGGSGSFDIVKLGSGGLQENLGSYDIETWPESFQMTLQESGSGNYLLKFRNADGSYAGRVMRTYKSSKPASAQVASGSTTPDMLAVMKLLSDNNASHERAMSEMRLEMARQQSDAMKNVLELVKSQASGGLIKSAQDVAEIGKMFRPERGGSDFENMLKYRDFMEQMRDEARGDVATDSNPLLAMLAPILSALVPVLTGGARRAAAQPSTPVAPSVAPSLAAPVVPPLPPAPVAVAPAAAPVAAGPGPLAEYVPSFKAAIESGVSPDDAADFAWAAAVEKGKDDGLAELLESADWNSLNADAYLKEHEGWVKSFRLRMESLAFESDDVPAVPVESVAAAPEVVPVEKNAIN